MISLRLPIAFTLTALLAGAGLQASSDTGPPYRSSTAYRNMVKQQSGIKSSVAEIEVHTKMRSFPPMSLTFHGHSYFQAPDMQAVVFDNVPGVIKGMVKDSPSIAPAPLWPKHYEVSIVSTDGTSTVFHLVSRNPNDLVQSADVTTDDATGEMRQLHFVNRNGSEVTNQQTYSQFGSHDVVVSSNGSAHGSGYKADTETTFTDYQFNVSIPPEVFEQH